MKQTKRVLSVVLALAMVFAMNVMVFAAGQTTAEPSAKATVEGDTVTVTLSVKGDIRKFDFGVVYDQKALELQKITINSTLKTMEDEDGNTAIFQQKNQTTNESSAVKGYAVVGCVCETIPAFENYDGELAVLTFKGTDASSIRVIKDSGTYYDAAVAAGKTDMNEQVPATGDGIVNVITDTPAVSEAPAVSGAPAASDTPDTTPSAVVPDTSATPDASVAPGASTTPNGGAQASTTPNGGAQASTTPTTGAKASTTPTTGAKASTTPAAGSNGTSTTSPKMGDTASVVVPVVAICAAAAAVVVASKKRVED